MVIEMNVPNPEVRLGWGCHGAEALLSWAPRPHFLGVRCRGTFLFRPGSVWSAAPLTLTPLRDAFLSFAAPPEQG
jgi:hypothetical protein